jgi:hypothetical protein
MSSISINPNNGTISIKVKVNSLQVVSFSMSVYAPDGSTILEHYNGDSQIANPFVIALPNAPSGYISDYVAGTIKIFDPQGEGNNFDIEIAIVQDNTDLQPTISLTGISASGIISHQIIFHLQ